MTGLPTRNTTHKETEVTYKSIEEEAADCRAAFAGVGVGSWVWFCHHEKMVEKLEYPAEERIAYILSYKPREEQAIRLREFRPVKDVAAVDDYDAKCAALDADYDAKRAPLNADYEAKRDALYADYEAKRDALYADYDAKRDALYADYNAKRDALVADYNAKRAALVADYEAKRAALVADYNAKCAPLVADYNAKRAPLDAELTALHLREVPDTAWDGKTLFGGVR